MAKMKLSLQCTECFVCIAEGPLRPATVIYLNTLAAEHVCVVAGEPPPSGAMTSEEIAALLDDNEKKLS